MGNEFVFSWAENQEGRMVHVDDVPRGLQCGCVCPNCREPLLARHGKINEHGFAHHSDTRGANLKICYMVILYKLAEQIIQTKKRIHAPSYYNIFPEKVIEFVEVQIDSSYEREDKQPDVIATTKDGKQYLIELTFDYKVQRKQAVDYKNMNCLEIDLSRQRLETVEHFLLDDNTDRKWLNNQDYFENIEARYKQANKLISVKSEVECENCELKSSCVGVKLKYSSTPMTINNSGHEYRLCKQEQYIIELQAYRNQKEKEFEYRRLFEERVRIYKNQKEQKRNLQNRESTINEGDTQDLIMNHNETKDDVDLSVSPLEPNDRTCFMCSSNLSWANRNGYANCGRYISLGVPKNTPPDYAKTCKGFSQK